MAGRWPTADEETRDRILQARETRDNAITAAEQQLLQTIGRMVDEERVTISEAAGLLGTHRGTLSAVLNAGQLGRRSGGGRPTTADEDARRELTEAKAARDESVTVARDAFLDLVAEAIDAGQVTVSAAAKLNDVHRTTLLRTLKERAARRAADG